MRDGWRRARLGEVITHQDHREPVESGVTYPLAGVYSFGRGLFWREPLEANKTKYKALHRLHAGQLVMSKLKAWEGALAVVPDEFDGAVLSPEFPTFTPGPCIDPEYLRLVVSDPAFADRLRSEARGVGGRRERVHPRRLLDVLIALPPLDEQKRIVDLLRAVSGVASGYRRLKDATSRLGAELTGRLLYSNDDWPVVPLRELASLNPERPTFGPSDTIRYVDLGAVSREGGIDLTAVEEMAFGEAPSRARRVVREDDVLVSTVRPYLRGFAVCPKELDGQLASTGFCVLRARPGVLPGYLWAIVQSGAFVDGLMIRATGSSYPAVRASDIAEQVVPLPPREEQQRIADLLASVTEVSSRAVNALRASKGALAALQHELLSGVHEIPESYDELLEAV